MKGSQIIVEQLKKEGVEFIFGLPGGPELPLLDELIDDSSLRYVLNRHEQASAFMADAYARVTGKIGVCMATIGPGATNLTTGIASSFLDSVPLLAITSHIYRTAEGKGDFQEIDQVSIFKPITKWNGSVRYVETLPDALQKALRISLTGRPGPVHLNINREVFHETTDTEILSPQKYRPMNAYYGAVDRAKDIVPLLLKSKRPVIWAGGGVVISNASNEVRDLAEPLRIPVATTCSGKGVMPEDHPLSVGIRGRWGVELADQILSEADLLIAIGCRFSAVATSRGKAKIPDRIIHIDIDPQEIGKNYPVEIGILGDAKFVLKHLLMCLKKERLPNYSDWYNRVTELRDKYRKKIEDQSVKGNTIKPQFLLKTLRKTIPRDTIATVDIGEVVVWTSQLFEVYQPRTYIKQSGFSPMGYGVPAAVASKLAKPEKTVVAICGDGGFMMTCYELETAVRLDTPIICVIFDNRALGEIKHRQEKLYQGRRIGVDFTDVDHSELAKSLGASGERIESPNELAPALKRALKSNQPYILDCIIDPREIPPEF